MEKALKGEELQGKALMEIRAAKIGDNGPIAELMHSAGPELYDFIYKTRTHEALDFIRYEYKTGKGFCGYKNLTVAVEGDKVMGTGCFYDGSDYNRLMIGSVLNMFKFYGPLKIWGIMLRSRHLSGVMVPPKRDELYLANFGVSSELRSTGIGGQMLQRKIDFAKSAGYKIFSLDVAVTNPRAEALYKKYGLDVICEKKFSGQRAGINVPDCRKMERVL